MYARHAVHGCAAALLALAAACETATGPGPHELTAAESAALASSFDAASAAVVDGPLAGASLHSAPDESLADRREGTVEFSVRRSCPEGGSVTIAGETVLVVHRESRSFTAQTTATQTHAGCAHEVRDGRGSVIVTVDGNPHVALAAFRKVVAGKPSGLQTHTQRGGIAWSTSDGRSGTCEIDLTTSFDPETGTHTLSGTFCHRQVRIVRTGQRP